VLTDAAGLLLLIPPTRAAFRRYLRKRFERTVSAGRAKVAVHVAGEEKRTRPGAGIIIDQEDVVDRQS
jgi:UPF0716 family protein affecting phage T7 exclusion